MIDTFLKEGLVKESEWKRAYKLYNLYFGENFKIKRTDVNNGGNDFREYLKNNVLSLGARNKVILVMERFFTFMIEYNNVMNIDGVTENPFNRKWDSFRTESYKGTKRMAIDLEVIDLLKELLLTKEDNSVRNCLYTMLCIPLRCFQSQFLDSGLKDEWIYTNGVMVKNKEGMKGRSFGVLQVINDKRYFFINTNKNGSAFFIPCIDTYLWDLLVKERERVSLIERKFFNRSDFDKETVKIYQDEFDLLFRHCDGRVVKREQIYSLWKKLCFECDKICGTGLTRIENRKRMLNYDLHSLRVSLISGFMKNNELLDVSRYISGHENPFMTTCYWRNSLDLSLEIKERERLIEYKEIL